MDGKDELLALRQENEALKKQVEDLNIRLVNFAREAFLADLLGSNRLTPHLPYPHCPCEQAWVF